MLARQVGVGVRGVREAQHKRTQGVDEREQCRDQQQEASEGSTKAPPPSS